MTIFQSVYELGTGLHANDVAQQAGRLKKLPSELRIGDVVLDSRMRSGELAIISSYCRAAAR